MKNEAVEEVSFVLAYDDLLAAQRGMRVIGRLAHGCIGARRWRRLAWKLDLLEHPACLQLAIAHAVNAALIVISISDGHGLAPAVETWIKSSLEQKRGDCAAVVALLGPSDRLDPPGSTRLEFVRQATIAAGLDFFAPFSNYESPLDPSIEISFPGTRPAGPTGPRAAEGVR